MSKREEPASKEKSAPNDEHYTLLITPPPNAQGDAEGRWQPTKISPKEGWAEITLWMKVVYIAMVLFTLGFDIHKLMIMPREMQIGTWFAMSSMTVPTVAYLAVSFGLMLYFIYRDLIRRSLSRYRLFMPFVVMIVNVLLLNDPMA